jgi:prophage regulatory protein
MSTKDGKQQELALESQESSASPGAGRILRLKQVQDRTGLCRSAIYQLQAEKRLPRSVKISARAVGWYEAEVQRWVEERPR